MTTEAQSKRAIIEYKEEPVEGKAIRFKTVIESAKDANDARAQFWAMQIWPATLTQGVSILSITWPDVHRMEVELKTFRNQKEAATWYRKALKKIQ